MIEEIIKTSLLGTDRYQPNLDFGFTDIMQKISESETDKEARFLKQTAAFFMVRSASYPSQKLAFDEPQNIEGENYITLSAQKLMQSALIEDNTHLLKYCFWYLEKEGKTISPFLIPDFLEKYSGSNQWKVVLALCGKIGMELSPYYAVDKETSQEKDIEIVDFSQFKNWLIETRSQNPSKIWDVEEGKTISSFEEIFNTEKPEKKVEMLELLQTGISAADEAFLIKQLKSRSKNVKQASIRLLIQIDNSAVQTDFVSLLKELLEMKDKKQFLGMKTSQSFVLASSHILSDQQKFYGLEEISSQKNISDPLFHLSQCIEWMPISLMAKTFGFTDEESFIEKIFSDINEPFLLNAFEQNAQYYKNKILVKHLIKTTKNDMLAGFLPFEESVSFFKNKLSSFTFGSGVKANTLFQIFNWLFHQDYLEIDNDFALLLLKALKTDMYAIQGKQYYQLGLFLPETCVSWLKKEQSNPLTDTKNEYFNQQILLTLKAIEDKKQLKS